jgi:carbamoyl-phosphate synthase large subunit
MALRTDIKKVLVIGSGPIIIGQAAEFDYAGSQACRALKEEGLEVVLINSNPATIMTDKNMADKVYIEPLTLETVKKIIRIERPDSLLSTLGGQTCLTLSMQLAKDGFLEEYGVKLLGADPETIHKAEDRQAFKDTMEKISQPCIPSKVVETVADALAYADNEIGYPVIVRPAFTLGGTGGGIANNRDELLDISTNGLRLSPITQVLIEKCISGWKEIEFEVMRDKKGNVITVCSMENFDPVGVHTGDSIVAAPAQTLADKEYQMLRSAALNIISELKVEGGCNVQFALKPDSFDYAVIEVNPRVSRSSALASKATGYPIAKVAAKIAIGYTLDEIINAVTGKTYACFEPTLDYIVLKFPKWPFDKFVYAKRTLGTQMMATGEVMAIGTSFEAAMMKAVRSIELSLDTLNLKKLKNLTDAEITKQLENVDDERAFCVFEALLRGITPEKINEITKIDNWFLYKLKNLADFEKEIIAKPLSDELYLRGKKYGYTDEAIERISGKKIKNPRRAVYKMVDTCAGEFAAETPYFYSTYDTENEAVEFKAGHTPTDKKTVIVFGSGPIRIGQGIEFDYCSVHCVWALKELGYDAVICNNNPETVSTDFDTGDRLYFDPLTKEDVESLLLTEKPYGVVVQFGGQTAIKLTKHLSDLGANILGTSLDSIDAAEDRERFDELLSKCEIPRPEGRTVMTVDEALVAAETLGYPVLMRPSYVLGGQNMIIARGNDDIIEYMEIITRQALENPVLIDKYMMGKEVEVDAICDGVDVLIPGIMEHVERAGVHSGDSISVYPASTLTAVTQKTILEYTRRLALELKVVGLVNIQYVVYAGEVFVIEVNPRSSRTVPYISKVTGVPMVDVATKIMFGHTLKEQGYESGLYKQSPYIAVKVPVFSFEKLHDVDTELGPEMKSTGECLGIARDYADAVYKGFIGAGYEFTKVGDVVLISVRDSDKKEVVYVAEKFERMGYQIYATSGTASYLNRNFVAANTVKRIGDGPNDIMDLLDSGRVDYVISTSAKGRLPALDGVKIRRKTVERSICCMTSIDTANAVADILLMNKSLDDIEMVDITKI